MKQVRAVTVADRDQSGLFEQNALACPLCDGLNLHPRGATVYARAEDGAQVARAFTDGHTVRREIVQNAASGNPSPRRGAFVLEFECESCGPVALALIQHKGPTYLQWLAGPDV